jgi:3-hydroxyisobutyrate dehydrogenase-like beta-hydroxyacid dehydrogenase
MGPMTEPSPRHRAGLRVGVIGLGVMGEPMALNVLAAGFPLRVLSRSPAPVERLVAAGASRGATPRDMARDVDVLLVTVPDTPDLAAVMEGPGGVLAGAHPGLVVVDHGTHDPAAMPAYATALRGAGGAFLDAPISGRDVAAREGTLSIMVGGDAEALARATPVLEAVGRTIVHIGPTGSGQVAKACNQLVVGATIEAVAEAHALAQAAGVEPARVFSALAGGLAASRVLELNGERMLTGDYSPGGRARLHLKDLRIARAIAAARDLELPALDLVADRFERLVASGGADLDHSALLTLLEGGADPGALGQAPSDAEPTPG